MRDSPVLVGVPSGPEFTLPNTVTLTVPANVDELDVVLDGAGTYLDTNKNSNGVRISRTFGVLAVGSHKVPVKSEGAPYDVDVVSDGTFDVTQPETGNTRSKKGPSLKETWTANAPTFDSVKDAYVMVPGSPHKMRLTLQDIFDGSTISDTSTVEVSVIGEGVDVLDDGTTTKISSKALTAGVVDLDVVPSKGFKRSELVVAVTDGVTGRRAEKRIKFTSDDDVSARWLPPEGIFPEVLESRITASTTERTGFRMRGNWDFLSARVWADGTPDSSGGAITLDVKVEGASILTAPLDLEQDLSGVVSASLSGTPEVDDGELVTFEVAAGSGTTGPGRIVLTFEMRPR